jgi:3-methyladenine DNA glycosylase AlkD
MAEPLAVEVRRALAARADPAKAEPMRAYMKSAMPFLGVHTPARRAALAEALAAQPPADADAWLAAILDLWRQATYREERHAAIDLLVGRPGARWLAPELVGTIEELIVGGAWWDLVDPLATKGMGTLLRAHPARVGLVPYAWSTDPDMWLRRSAIICQVGSKGATDTALLTAAIDANLGQRDFFIRKAIGWALREYAKTAPNWVAAFLDERGTRLSPLSRREAAKHLPTPPQEAT